MRVLPWISLALWGLAIACLVPSVGRLYRGSRVRRPADEWRGVTFFAAGLFVAFGGRRLFMPADEQAIVALYAISISLAVLVLILLGQERT